MQTLPQLVAVVGFLVTGKLDAVPETIGSLHHDLLDTCIPKLHQKCTTRARWCHNTAQDQRFVLKNSRQQVVMLRQLTPTQVHMRHG
jgi:hypothetical protein